MFICEQCFRVMLDEWELERHRELNQQTGHWAWDLLNWNSLDTDYGYVT